MPLNNMTTTVGCPERCCFSTWLSVILCVYGCRSLTWFCWIFNLMWCWSSVWNRVCSKCTYYNVFRLWPRELVQGCLDGLLVIVKGTALGQSALIPNPAIFVRAYQTPGYFDCLLFPLELLAGVLRNNIKVMVCLVNDFGIAQLLWNLKKYEKILPRSKRLICWLLNIFVSVLVYK